MTCLAPNTNSLPDESNNYREHQFSYLPAAPRDHQASQDTLLNQDLRVLELTIRTDNSLRRNGLHLIADLVGMDEQRLQSYRNCGAASLNEVRSGLARLGLELPFSSEQAMAICWEKKSPIETEWVSPSWASDLITSHPHSDFSRFFPPHSLSEDLLQANEEKDQRWQERAKTMIVSAAVDPSRLLEELTSLSLEHFSSLEHRLMELQQLSAVSDSFHLACTDHADWGMAADMIQAVILERYCERLGSVSMTLRWLRNLLKCLASEKTVATFLRHCSGETLEAIGSTANPPISREAVRKSISKLTNCLGCVPNQLAKQVASLRVDRERQQLASLLHTCLEWIGRFPFHTDAVTALPGEGAEALASRLQEVACLNLSHRLDLYAELAIKVPEAEWALHLRVIANNEEDAGSGYWHNEEAMRQFLHRYAVVIGSPGLMPKQKQLPSAVRGAVQRHGKQSGLAAKVGLHYQGQLVGENGTRTYWTEERLADLLKQTCGHFALASNSMPSRRQIVAFLRSGVAPDYIDKQSASVFAALSRQSTLNWEQVAARFGHIITIDLS